jgi:hypothetical protein
MSEMSAMGERLRCKESECDTTDVANEGRMHAWWKVLRLLEWKAIVYLDRNGF